MTTLYRITLILFLTIHISCEVSTKKEGTFVTGILVDSLKTNIRPYESSIRKDNNNYEIDSSVIIENKNLPTLISQLDTSHLKAYFKFQSSPKFIRNFLKQIYSEDFIIADTGQHFAAGCTRLGNEPFRQLQYLGFNSEFFIMTYKIGGWALMEYIVIIKFKGDLIVDFWTGDSSGGLNSKVKTLSFLNEQL